GRLSSAAPTAEECHSPHMLCFDAVNPYGVIYSGLPSLHRFELTDPSTTLAAAPPPSKPPISYSY
ncbi:hypothetical protein NEUTE2DRAFT_48469, partial [Neurospora tetrasperma FGSC 2509]